MTFPDHIDAREILRRWASGHTDFRQIYARGISLSRAHLMKADFSDSILSYADLSGAVFTDALFVGADLGCTNFELSVLDQADLRDADLRSALFVKTFTSGAKVSRATVGHTVLCATNLWPFIDERASLKYVAPSFVDPFSIALSVEHPGLPDFLTRIGMPEVFVLYMIEAARAVRLKMTDIFRSTFISYGAPDEPFARKLYESLHRNGITTFFFPETAVPGEKLHRLMRKGINAYDRVILVCSEASLNRPGVLNEIEETLAREARGGGQVHLVPITLDQYVFNDWAPTNIDLAQAVRDRVVADFREADTDDNKFGLSLVRLLGALRK